MAAVIRDALEFPTEDQEKINTYLPQPKVGPRDSWQPFVTLTFATSLDSQLSLAPGVQTTLSGPRSKAMTHYLRSKHDAILIGVGTAIADDPSLNCRLLGVGGYGGKELESQPRPIILDPSGRWQCGEQTKVLQLAKQGKGRPPWVLTFLEGQPGQRREVLEQCGGKYIIMPKTGTLANGRLRMDWNDILTVLKAEGIESVMIEGGGNVINSLLAKENSGLIDAVIVTIAPTWLGQGGVVVSPKREEGPVMSVARLQAVSWQPLGEDVVLCGRLNSA